VEKEQKDHELNYCEERKILLDIFYYEFLLIKKNIAMSAFSYSEVKEKLLILSVYLNIHIVYATKA